MSPAAARPIRVAVVGVGYFGRFHAQQYAANKGATLVAVTDVVEDTARAVAAEFGCDAAVDHRLLIGRVDAVSIAVPTPHHAAVARDLIEAGVHVLVEKPMTDDVESASALVACAESRGALLQVGHIERFSACYRELARKVTRPLYIESNRIAPWRERGTDVDVVFDLMIHDIDIIMGLVASPIVSVHAVGTPLMSKNVDLANARLAFASGCVANVTASRVSHKSERSLRLFQPNGYHVCDFGNSNIFSYSVKGDITKPNEATIEKQSLMVPKENSLANQIADFLDCVRTGRQPLIDARAGYEAVHVAKLITDSISAHGQKIASFRS
jgi:predicted dehydrogenase